MRESSGPVGKWPPQSKEAVTAFDAGVVGFWLLVFAALSFVTAFVAQLPANERRIWLASGETSEPITISERNTLLNVTVAQRLATDSWSFPELQLLDADKEYLFSFGDELWYETGRDSDGPWVEHHTTYGLDVRVPEPGIYHLAMQIDGAQVPVLVTFGRLHMSFLPHFWAAVVALGAGLVLAISANAQQDFAALGKDD